MKVSLFGAAYQRCHIELATALIDAISSLAFRAVSEIPTKRPHSAFTSAGISAALALSPKCNSAEKTLKNAFEATHTEPACNTVHVSVVGARQHKLFHCVLCHCCCIMRSRQAHSECVCVRVLWRLRLVSSSS
jgi:hypothetical protein